MEFKSIFSLIALQCAVLSCTNFQKNGDRFTPILLESVSRIVYLNKSDTILFVNNREGMKKIVSTVNAAKMDRNIPEFKSFQFVLFKLSNHSDVRIECFGRYFRINQLKYKADHDIDSLIFEWRD